MRARASRAQGRWHRPRQRRRCSCRHRAARSYRSAFRGGECPERLHRSCVIFLVEAMRGTLGDGEGGLMRGSVAQGAQRGGGAAEIGCERPGMSERVERSEAHTSELQSLMLNSYAVFCLKQNTKTA